MVETPQQRNAEAYASGPRSGIKTPIRELILDSKPSSPEAKCSNFKSGKKSIQSIQKSQITALKLNNLQVETTNQKTMFDQTHSSVVSSAVTSAYSQSGRCRQRKSRRERTKSKNAAQAAAVRPRLLNLKRQESPTKDEQEGFIKIVDDEQNLQKVGNVLAPLQIAVGPCSSRMNEDLQVCDSTIIESEMSKAPSPVPQPSFEFMEQKSAQIEIQPHSTFDSRK